MGLNLRRGISISILGLTSVMSYFPATVVAQDVTPSTTAVAPVPPQSWVDKDTNHRVMRLTTQQGSRGLYFNENAFTPDGTEMIYTAGPSVYVLDLTTYKSRQLLAGPVLDIVVGHKSPTVYFMKPADTSLYAVGVNTGQVLKIATLPAGGEISSLNADETLAAGVYVEGNGLEKLKHAPDPNLKASSLRATAMDERLAAHIPMVLFTLDLRTAKIATVLHSTDWINHVQFSPKDPTLIMYCHEGLWWKVDRIWTIRTDGTHNQLVHTRTVKNEIAGHEFWDADGKTIWYDLQIPRGHSFYVASYNVETQARKWYTVDRDAWSIHYNVAADDTIFCGDGGDYAQVAKSKQGQWIELFKPKDDPETSELDQSALVQSGFFESRHLVNMEKQDYKLEPNVRFSPDHKLVIFSSNMFGPSYVFAVEVAKATPAPTK
jgi:oligogalacturonide lyase